MAFFGENDVVFAFVPVIYLSKYEVICTFVKIDRSPSQISAPCSVFPS